MAKMKEVKLNKTNIPSNKSNLGNIIKKDISRNKVLYYMMIPVIAYYIIFHYIPMYGAVIAFKDFSPALGILESPWAGFKHFIDFFNSYHFERVVKNTFTISLNTLLFGFPAPILLALLINELKNKYFTRTVQTISYLPHFISMVVIAGMIRDFTSLNGVINDIVVMLGGGRTPMLSRPELFLPIYVISDIWQGIGWGSIIYLAALTGIDPQLYEAAYMDGAGRLRQTVHITLPGIMPTIVILLILRMGSILSVGFEKIILLYSPATYETADVISSFVYRRGLQDFDYSFSAAVGLFNSLINFTLLILANAISRKVNETSLW